MKLDPYPNIWVKRFMENYTNINENVFKKNMTN